MPLTLSDSMVTQPWLHAGVAGDLVCDRGRAILMLPANVEEVVVEGTGERLPLLGRLVDHRRFEWHKFELPATGSTSENGPVHDEIGVKASGEYMEDGGGLRVSLQLGLPKPMSEGMVGAIEDERGKAGVARNARLRGGGATVGRRHWQQAAGEAAKMMTLHLNLVNRLYGSGIEDPEMFFDGTGGGIGAWPLGYVLEAWREVGRQQGPEPSLVVSLAGSVGRKLTDVCERPRKVLTRKREVQGAGRIQEVDSTCLRWLARQPGTTVAEKVGVKQLAMGITRVETVDTLENRVVRDLLSRITRAGEEYVKAYDKDGTHELVERVKRFLREVERLKLESPIGRLRRISGVPQPNNVMQHDPRYRPLWRAYVKLLNRELEREKAWRWRHRVFAETCELGLMAAMSNLVPQATGMRSTLLVKSEQTCGRFLDKRSAVGRWDVLDDGVEVSMLLVSGRQIDAYRKVGWLPEELGTLCPDAVVICRDVVKPDSMPKRILAIWSLLEFDLGEDRLKERTTEIRQAMSKVPSQSELHGMLILPAIGEKEGVVHGMEQVVRDEERQERFIGMRLSLPLQSHEMYLTRVLREVLSLP